MMVIVEDGEIDWEVQSPEEAALEATAEEAGAYGDIISFLGPIEDHWKFTLTRWFHLDNVVFEDDYKRPLDIWTEKDLRKRKWVPLVSEEVAALMSQHNGLCQVTVHVRDSCEPQTHVQC